MSARGQNFGGSFLQGAFDRFASPELVDFVRRWKIDLVEVESLERTSAKIQALFDDAEVKQFRSVAVKLWLNHLKQLLYDAEDLLDEYATELLRLKLESEYHETHSHQIQQSGTESAIEGVNETIEGIGPQVYNLAEELQGIKGFGSKLKDMDERLNREAEAGVALGLSLKPRIFSQRPPTGSLVNKSKVFGREEDMLKIVKWLLLDKTPRTSNSTDSNFSVLPIVGMGGSGKTTLAQLVYNHETVENSKYFDLKGWVCVSEDFDMVRLTKEILESVTRSSESCNSLDVLQMKLKEALSRKRFLLVLDDMWNEDYERWDVLSTVFAFGKPGSKILVTTRNKSVSSIVRTAVPNDHDLKCLSDEACLELVRRHAFMEGNSADANQKLQVFGQEILNKCKGLPLAVKTLAGLLRDKKENNEWKDILENEIWDLRESESGILPSLMLSYHHLPPLVKRCFAYCALFPKDYEFDKIELVMLWMAEGIVPKPNPKGRKRVEDIGAGYFDELFMRSFFELSSNCSPHYPISPFVTPDSYDTCEELFYELSNEIHIRSFFESSNTNTGSRFVMHDLIHDLAQFVLDGMYCRTENDKPAKVVTKTRHLSYLTDYCNIEVANQYEAMESLRTLMHLEGNRYYPRHQLSTTLQFQSQFLRVLRVRIWYNRELPDSIGKLKHLRLLDLSFSNIVRLPNSVTNLHNLQTLNLTACWGLTELPEDMANLVNLRYLFLPVWSAASYKMPLGVNKLTSLQRLSTFIVGSKNSSELRDLSQLRGTLDISNLENVGKINGTEALVSNLRSQPHLLGLRLRWSHYKSGDNFYDLGRDEKVEEDVLDQLQPHTNLKALSIQNYGGTRFPSWIEHLSCFSNLETVSLFNCHKCRFLPQDLKQLPLLKHLVIGNFNAMKSVGSELHGNCSSSSNNKFRSLETLHIQCMDEWEEWPQVVEEEEEDGGEFPCLHELIIHYCPKLMIFSKCFPSLMELTIESCDDLREVPQLLPSLRQLNIFSCPKLVVLPSLPSIERLNLSRCDHITISSSSSSSSSTMSTPHVDNSFPFLRKLRISYCPNLRELPRILPSLESLKIDDCRELCFLPMLPSIKELRLDKCKGMILNNETLPHLSSLSSLTISYAEELRELPNGFMQQLTALQSLNISRCILPGETGSDLFPSRIQYLEIHDCDNLGMLIQSTCILHCLRTLRISGARGLVSFPETGLSTMLQELEIRCCENLESLPKALHTLTSLQELSIIDCKKLESLPMGLLHNFTSLRILTLWGYPNLKSLPEGLHKLTSLQKLAISDCPALESFPNMGFPTTLRTLSIVKCGKLNFSPKQLHKLTNLQRLEIMECSFLVDCNNQEPLLYCGLHNLASLSYLAIGGCPSLVSIPKGMLPMNIVKFCIMDCPILESLQDGLSDLTFLKSLHIRKCPMLTQRCQEKEGEEWSKIAHIPTIFIDDKLIQMLN